MTFVKLLTHASLAYRQAPNELRADLLDYVDPSTGELLSPPPSGDTLALFIVRELSDTFDPDASDTDQLVEAFRVIRRASKDLHRVAIALAAAS